MKLFTLVVNPVVNTEARRWTYMDDNFMPGRHYLHLQLPPLFSLHPLSVELFGFLLEILLFSEELVARSSVFSLFMQLSLCTLQLSLFDLQFSQHQEVLSFLELEPPLFHPRLYDILVS